MVLFFCLTNNSVSFKIAASSIAELREEQISNALVSQTMTPTEAKHLLCVTSNVYTKSGVITDIDMSTSSVD